MQLEEMSQFFNTRVDTYEEHMRTCVDGANEYYEKTAARRSPLAVSLLGRKCWSMGRGRVFDTHSIQLKS